ncbi:hypothetical protein PP1_031360 [Pseudonocardia sp. P1]
MPWFDLADALLDSSEHLVHSPAWDDAAADLTAAILSQLNMYEADRSRTAVHHDYLQAQITELRAERESLRYQDVSGWHEWCLRALRITLAICIGAAVAGPLAATVPAPWSSVWTETSKAALGALAGALTNELVGPIERRASVALGAWAVARRSERQEKWWEDHLGNSQGDLDEAEPNVHKSRSPGVHGYFKDPNNREKQHDPQDEIGGFRDPTLSDDWPRSDGFDDVAGM